MLYAPWPSPRRGVPEPVSGYPRAMPDSHTLSVPKPLKDLTLPHQLKDLSVPDQLKEVPQQLKDLTHDIPTPSLPSRRKRRRAARKLKAAVPTPRSRRRRSPLRVVGRGLLVSLGVAALIAAALAAKDAASSRSRGSQAATTS